MLLHGGHTRPERLTGSRAVRRACRTARGSVVAVVSVVAVTFVSVVVGVVAVVGVVLGTATPSGAHNDRTAFTGIFGPYDVVASVRYVHEAERGVLLDLLVRTAESKRPVDDATVRVEADSGTRTVGPLDADRYGSTYRVVLPGDDIESWEVETSIDGGPGRSTFTRTVPGVRDLLGDAAGSGGSGDATGGGWTAATIGVLLLVGAAGLTRWWRPAMRAAALVLLVSCGAALAGSWAEATAPAAAKAAALVAPLVAAGLLIAGLVTSRDRHDEALLLVFLGAAGLAVLFGWLDHSFLATDASTLSPTFARLTVTTASGLGTGLALLVTACHRAKLRALLPRPSTATRERPAEPESTS